MFCSDIPAPIFLFFSDTTPLLLYYSHLPALLLSVMLGLFVYSKSQSLISRLLLVIVVLFSVWIVIDLITWTNIDSRIIMFVWSMMNPVSVLISATTLYFAYVFVEKHDVSLVFKGIGAALLFPMILLAPTSLNVSGFDLVACEAQQGVLLWYYYFLQVVFISWTLGYLVYRHQTFKVVEFRKQILVVSTGITFFLMSFFGGTLIGNITEHWEYEQYGLFGVFVFLGAVLFLIVRYHAFDTRMFGAQALVLVLISLVSSQFFFSESQTSDILIGITVIFVFGFGSALIRSIRRDLDRKEELQQISDRLALANQELKRLDTAKSEFISIASHQLRTPLTAIKGYTSLILEGNYGKIDSQLQDVVSKVYAANARLIDLVENLLSISRLESGRMQYDFRPTQIEEIVTDLGNMFSVNAKKRGLDFSVVLPEQPLPKIDLDSAKIREVMSNLIDNAIKYTEKGSVTVSLWQEGDKLRYSVKDTGIGVTEEDKGRLFSKFARSKETERLYVGGTGLGLYVGKIFVEKHGGRIWVESAGHNLGSEFIFELPISHNSL